MTSETLARQLGNLDRASHLGHIAETIELPAVAMRVMPFPVRYESGPVSAYLKANSASPDGIYRHQQLAAQAFDAGQDVVISTRTNSGKSRTFSAEAFHTIMQDDKARVLVFYPLKTLGLDQYKRWIEMAEGVGLTRDIIGRLDGRVPTVERPKLIERSRILLATPDVFHAWVMDNIGKPEVQKLLRNRQLTIIDELDTFNGAFGTNMMFMLQRMEYAQRALSGKDFSSHRYIGASATLPNAQNFFKTLTGRTAAVIDEAENGAPQQERVFAHYAAQPENQIEAISALIEVQLDDPESGQGIVFVDSRKKVEEMAARLNEKHGREVAIAQKAGYTMDEQARLDGLVRSGRARVVIATSSMESGVDYDFSWGINAGVPLSKRAFMQRTGRIGRHHEGLFIVVDREDAFRRKPQVQSLRDYMDASFPEDPILYPQNEFIQIAQALCTLDEARKLRESGSKLYPNALQGFVWARGFVKSLDIASKPEEHLTGERSLLVPPEGAKVHYFHSLRRLSGAAFKLCEKRKGGPGGDYEFLGDCSLQQAILEFPPGAIVSHLRRRYRVEGWQSMGRINRVILSPYSGHNTTFHHIQRDIRIGLEPKNLIKGAFRQDQKDEAGHDPKPFMTIIRGQSIETVSSFVEIAPGGATYPHRFYDDHEIAEAEPSDTERDYGPRRRSRISTTGVLLYVPNFRISEDIQVGKELRERLFGEILDQYCEGMNINRNDVSYATQGMLWHLDKGALRDGFVFFHDTTPGSLGLSHGLFNHKQHNLGEILGRIRDNISDTREAGYSRAARLFHRAFRDMVAVEAEQVLKNRIHDYPLPDKHIIVAPPGSLALLQQEGGSAVLVKVKDPVVQGGIPGYLIHVADRKAAFKATQWATVDKGTMQQWGSGEKKVAPTLSSRFIAAAYIKPYGTESLAMHVETGVLLAPAEGQTWIPFTQDAKPA